MSMIPPQTPHSKPRSAKQAMRDQTNVNKIVETSRRVGALVSAHQKPAQYLDLTILPSYQDALNLTIGVERVFRALPAAVRDAVGNSPQGFVAFMADPKNKEEAIKLGLLKAPPPPPTADKNAEDKTSDKKEAK